MKRLFQTLEQEGVLTPFNFARVVEKATKYVLCERKFLGKSDGYFDVKASNVGTHGEVVFVKQIIFNPDTGQRIDHEEKVDGVCLPSDSVADVAMSLFTKNWANSPYDLNEIEYVGQCIEVNNSEFHAAVSRIKQMLL